MDFNTHVFVWIQHFGQNLQLVLVNQLVNQHKLDTKAGNLSKAGQGLYGCRKVTIRCLMYKQLTSDNLPASYI